MRKDGITQRISKIQGAAVGAEGQAVGNADAGAHRHHRATAFQAVKHAFRRARHVVHGADPEAALRIAAAVIEAVAVRLRRGLHERRQDAGGRVKQGDFPGQGHQQPVVIGQRDGAGKSRQRPAVNVPGGRMKPAKRRPANVEPVQALRLVVPQRGLAQDVGLRADTLGLCRKIADGCAGGKEHAGDLRVVPQRAESTLRQLGLRNKRRRCRPSFVAKRALLKFQFQAAGARLTMRLMFSATVTF